MNPWDLASEAAIGLGLTVVTDVLDFRVTHRLMRREREVARLRSSARPMPDCDSIEVLLPLGRAGEMATVVFIPTENGLDYQQALDLVKDLLMRVALS